MVVFTKLLIGLLSPLCYNLFNLLLECTFTCCHNVYLLSVLGIGIQLMINKSDNLYELV